LGKFVLVSLLVIYVYSELVHHASSILTIYLFHHTGKLPRLNQKKNSVVETTWKCRVIWTKL